MTNQGTHTLTIGDITCTIISDGAAEREFTVDPLAERYPNAPLDELEAAVAHYHPDGVGESSMNPMLIQSGGTTLLMDTGMGRSAQPDFGHLRDNLTTLGVEQVDMVFITHFHGDHINGLVDANGEPAFPDARLLTAEIEWEHWMAQEEFGSREMLQALADQFELVVSGVELLPGVATVALPGHTPGHYGLRVESGGERLTHLVDILHHPAQMHYKDWHFVFDTYPEQAVSTRQGALHMAAASGEQVVFYHLPFPGLGVIHAEDDGFLWEPRG